MRRAFVITILVCIAGTGLASAGLADPLPYNGVPSSPTASAEPDACIYPLPYATPTPRVLSAIEALYIPYWAAFDAPVIARSNPRPLAGELDSARPMGFVTRRGDQLWCDGRPFTFTGVCIHYLVAPSFPEEKMAEVVEYLSGEGITAIRLWLLPEYDLDRFARLLDLGRQHNMRFVVTLVDYYFHKDMTWFKGEGRTSYLQHVRRVVTRFRDRPEIIIWELMNEPGCGPEGGSQACLDSIYKWVSTASAEVKSLDPDRPISIGTMRAGWTEAERDNYYRMHALDTIDVVSIHKRASRLPLPELQTARELGKPVMIGEVWSQAYKENCRPLSATAAQERAHKIEADLARCAKEGVDGYLLWNFSYGAVPKGNGKQYFCSKYGYYKGDPAFAVLRKWGRKLIPSIHQDSPD